MAFGHYKTTKSTPESAFQCKPVGKGHLEVQNMHFSLYHYIYHVTSLLMISSY